MLIERNVDLLSTDIIMLGISGIELAKQGMFIRPRLKVVYTTGLWTPWLKGSRSAPDLPWRQ